MHEDVALCKSLTRNECILEPIKKERVLFEICHLVFLHDVVKSTIRKNFSPAFSDTFEFKLGWALKETASTDFAGSKGVELVSTCRSFHTERGREHGNAKCRLSHYPSVQFTVLLR